MDIREILKKSGGAIFVAKHFGITKGAVYHWDKVPPMRCKEISRLSGIPLKVLRPDIY